MQYPFYEDVSYYNWASFLGYLLGFMVFILIVAVIAYVFSAIIFSNTANTNGFHEIAMLSWIPIVNIYVFFAVTSKKTTMPEIKQDALKFTLIYFGLTIVTLIPVLGFLAAIALMVLMVYYFYHLFYRWSGDQGKAILFVILMYVTLGIFFYVYGILKMKDRFLAW